MSDPQARRSPEIQRGADTDRSRKARMLVSLLGADFAKKSDHPFFRRLAETAAGEDTAESNARTPDMSAALTGLLSALDEVSSNKTVAAKPAPKPTIPRKATTAAADPVKTRTPASESSPDADNLGSQHPALIAKRLAGKGTRETTRLLKTLPGPKARQVALILREIGRG